MPVEIMIITVVNQRSSLESSRIQQVLGQDYDLRNAVFILNELLASQKNSIVNYQVKGYIGLNWVVGYIAGDLVVLIM